MSEKWTVNNIPDQTGRTAIVTGSNSGIGFEAAKALAGKGANVILAVRNETKGQRAIDAIREVYPQASLEMLPSTWLICTQSGLSATNTASITTVWTC